MADADPHDLTVIDLHYDNVLGPILYKRPIPDYFAEHLIGQTVLFFIPISEFSPSSLDTLPSITGTNVYSYTSSLPVMAIHQGLILLKPKDLPPNSYSKILNVFSPSWSLVRQDRRSVRVGPQPPVGIELLITFTPKRSPFESSRQFGIKSKTSRAEVVGMALIFGQPTLQRYDTFSLKDLCSMDFASDLIDEPLQWLRFSLTGEPANSYDIQAFLDDGLPWGQWLGMKLHRQCVYLDTITERYELSMALNGQSMRFARLKPPLQCISHLTGNGTPAKEAKKEVICDHLQWEDIVWEQEGIVVRDVRYGPILNYFWCKRKRLVTGTPSI